MIRIKVIAMPSDQARTYQDGAFDTNGKPPSARASHYQVSGYKLQVTREEASFTEALTTPRNA